MGLETESDVEKICSLEPSPNTVLPNCNVTYKDGLLKLKEHFTEISFSQYRTSSCKNVPSRPVDLQGNIDLKRDSIYQSSREARKMKRMGTNKGRRKIELYRASEASLPVGIVDLLCSSDEENSQKRYSPMSLNSNSSGQKSCLEPFSSNGYIEICPNMDNREMQCAAAMGCGLNGNLNFRCEQVAGPLNNGIVLPERYTALAFNKSLSANAKFLHPPSPSGSDFSSVGSSKSRFSPIRKLFNPFVKSKSLRNPSSNIAKATDIKGTGMANMRQNQTFQKSFLDDFLHSVPLSNFEAQLVEKDHLRSAVTNSPVHLHGCLKLQTNQAVPFFEFSLNCPVEIFVAKMWKADKGFSWLYTFHSISNKKKSDAVGWRLADGDNESLVVGQMQVSCSESKDSGSFDNSMVAEFVLYDVAHARQSSFSPECSDDNQHPDGFNTCVADIIHELDDGSDAGRLKHKPEHAFDKGNFDSSNAHPWPPAALHPNHEIAAISIQLPFLKRENLKLNGGDKSRDYTLSNSLNLYTSEQKRQNICGIEGLEKVKVVIPAGHHSLPSPGSPGPSSLLDRWKSRGGCDCGGWDMACPITVLGSPCIPSCENQVLVGNQQPLQLFVQVSLFICYYQLQ